MKTFDLFAKEIGFNKQILDNLVTFADRHYNSFYIAKKKKSKKRQITSPSKELKAVQRWLLVNYFSEIPVSNRANGFVKGRGIKRNAQFHLDKRFILSIDIKDFFPSISQKMVYNALKNFLYDKDLILKISKICTYKRYLPQGAPTSPALSNIVFKDLDDSLTNFCNAKLVVYSRYADDMVFSSNTKNSLIEVYSYVNELLIANGFRINKAKTKYFSGKGRMVVTGININEGKLTISQSLKRSLRSQLYHSIVKKDETINQNSISGYLSFIKDIEPLYYKHMKEYINKLKSKAE